MDRSWLRIPEPGQYRDVIKIISCGQVVSKEKVGRSAGSEDIGTRGNRKLDDALEVLVIFAG